jgi:hypothetical protein
MEQIKQNRRIYMRYGIFDSRRKDVYIFQDEKTGCQKEAIYNSKEEAERIAAHMNNRSKLTTYIVKPL